MLLYAHVLRLMGIWITGIYWKQQRRYLVAPFNTFLCCHLKADENSKCKTYNYITGLVSFSPVHANMKNFAASLISVLFTFICLYDAVISQYVPR